MTALAPLHPSADAFPATAAQGDTAAPRPARVRSDAWHCFWNDPLARRSAWLLALMVAACTFLPLAWPWEPMQIDRSSSGAAAPSLQHPLGTDALGRDQLARLLAAGRVSLTIGITVAVVASCIGGLVGIVSGYVGGRTDELLMLLVDVLLTVPPLPLLIAVSGMLASGPPGAAGVLDSVPEVWRIVAVMSLLGWMTIARVVRSEVLRIRTEPFVEAAIASGATHRRIMQAHVLRNVGRPMLVFCAMSVSAAIMGESGLSFLGLGVSPPQPTWGNMIAEAGSVFLFLHQWWLVWTPALAIVATIMALNFVTAGLERALLDP